MPTIPHSAPVAQLAPAQCDQLLGDEVNNVARELFADALERAVNANFAEHPYYDHNANFAEHPYYDHNEINLDCGGDGQPITEDMLGYDASVSDYEPEGVLTYDDVEAAHEDQVDYATDEATCSEQEVPWEEHPFYDTPDDEDHHTPHDDDADDTPDDEDHHTPDDDDAEEALEWEASPYY